MLKNFQTYPFEKMRLLLQDIQPKKEMINLTIGEPQFQTPQEIQESLRLNTNLLSKYPKSSGEDFLKTSQLSFIKQRFDITLKHSQIIPTFGTREVLFNFPQFLLFELPSPCIAYPNPFYQIYEGAAIASKAKILLMNLNEANHFKPTLTPQELQEVNLVILNSPNNPTGAILTLDELKEWVKLALQYDFVILSDECYSEIYEDTPPHSILEASIAVGNKDFKNILALNSISKRSSAPGLRSGFIAGDEEILQAYGLYRTYVGCAIPLPLQKAAAIGWELSSEKSRKIYAQNLKIARSIFCNHQISPFTFYVWLEVKNELEFVKNLYQQEGIMVLPGSFLGRNGGGEGFVRIALVYQPPIIKDALTRIATMLKKEQE